MSTLLTAHCWALALTRLAVVVTVGFIVVCALWRVQGGQWNRVESPSMGTQAPVGSLLWVAPVDVDTLRVGDFITFRPPGSTTTYSHLVAERHADGTLGTQGVIPGPDPWRLGAEHVEGRVVATWWGVGWLVAAAPVLLVGGLVVAAVRSALQRAWQLPATLVLGSLVVSIAITIHQPFTGAQELGFVAHDDGGARATYVGTGLLPIRLASVDSSVVLGAGEVGSVDVAAQDVDEDGRLQVWLRPAVPVWWWVATVLACLLPALLTTLRDALRRRRGSPGRAWAAGSHRRPRAAFP